VLVFAVAWGAFLPGPRHSIVFVAFGAEEFGLQGSHYFAEHPPCPISDIPAMVNLDMIGRLRPTLGLNIEGMSTAATWRALVDRENRDGLRISINNAMSGGSDHNSFYVKGRPVLSFFTGFHSDYHRPSDTADRIDADGLAKVARLAQRIIRELADSPAPDCGLSAR
jgi:Zn-dependent M28 family amino/carboxypeptidase